MASFAFLPFVGEAIAIALGFMRSNLMLTTTSMFVRETGALHSYAVGTARSHFDDELLTCSEFEQ